ncbi:MAG: alanine racemase [Phycisphaerales bacterium]|nr:alanine racemase [Phycisphaerales bacterium]
MGWNPRAHAGYTVAVDKDVSLQVVPMRTKHITATIDLDHIRANAERIRAHTRVPVVAVIKADAYGLGAARVADAIASAVDDFAYFYVSEAREVGRPGLVIGPPEDDPSEYRELGLRPSIGSLRDAERFRGVRVAVTVDTGMQRFGCDPGDLDALLEAVATDEIHTHAANLDAVERFVGVVGGRPLRKLCACTAMLECREAWLDGVRPGIGLYRGSTRVSTRLYTVRDTQGPIGYTGFVAPRVGVILGGYTNRIAPGAPVIINGRRQVILETGMNSSYVSVEPGDRAGDEVVLLGDGLTEAEVGSALNVREHEVLCRYGAGGVRVYCTGSLHSTAVQAATCAAE